MIKNNEGSTLVMLLLMLAVLSILGIGLLNTSINENRHAIKEHDSQQAYFVARAGAEATAKFMEDKYMSKYQLNTYLSQNSDHVDNKPVTNFADGHFKVSMFKSSNFEKQLVVQSIGWYKDVERTVTVALEQGHPFDSAIIALNQISIANPSNCNIYGNVGTVNDPATSIIYKDKDTPGQPSRPLTEAELADVLTGDDGITHEVNQISGNFPEVNQPILWTLDDYNAENVDEPPIEKSTFINGTINSIDFPDGLDLGDFDIGSNSVTVKLTSDMELAFDNLESNSGTLFINSGDGGEHLLEIYVDEMNVFKGDIEISDNVKVVLLVNRGGEIYLKTGSSLAELYIYAPEASVDISANYLTIGSVIAWNVYLSSGADVHFEESNGEFPDNVEIDMHNYLIKEWKEYSR